MRLNEPADLLTVTIPKSEDRFFPQCRLISCARNWKPIQPGREGETSELVARLGDL